MNLSNERINDFEENQKVCKDTLKKCKDQIQENWRGFSKCIIKSNTIFWCGNGGSASEVIIFQPNWLADLKK